MKRRQRAQAESSDDDDEAEEEVEDDDEEDEQDEARQPIYQMEAIHDKLEDIGWTSEAAWEETLIITHKDNAQVENVDDDLARELTFYNQALSATQEAIRRFESAGVPWLRPTDYYAEMVKTDEHMAKVKEQLMHEQKQIELAEERRKQREQKQYSKQVQAERIKQKAQDKKHQIDSISKLRKQREKSGFAGELDYDAEIKNLDRRSQHGKPQDRNQPARGGSTQVNKKRQAKDSKYGFGGSKRMNKQNDAFSAANMDGYKGPGGKGSGGKGPGGKGPGGKGPRGKTGKAPLKAKGGVKKAAQRPGKARRQSMKAR